MAHHDAPCIYRIPSLSSFLRHRMRYLYIKVRELLYMYIYTYRYGSFLGSQTSSARTSSGPVSQAA